MDFEKSFELNIHTHTSICGQFLENDRTTCSKVHDRRTSREWPQQQRCEFVNIEQLLCEPRQRKADQLIKRTRRMADGCLSYPWLDDERESRVNLAAVWRETSTITAPFLLVPRDNDDYLI
ncbi:hypothetical protein K0M31_008426 [Melipona bicolor]|uniref:Uncharacterized protein n=1 Tax=Melipona bicolor TaxID=60889 RepID=A0AA40KKK7_9HYME|nr:hypothetical protein K0M31_008426 [Melipona bicolor]